MISLRNLSKELAFTALLIVYRREGDACWHPGGAQYADAARRARPHHVERRRHGDEPSPNRSISLKVCGEDGSASCRDALGFNASTDTAGR